MRARLEAGLVDFTGEIITPESAAYGAATRNALTAGAPALVLRPADTADVQRAVRFAAESGRPLAVRGGGHSAAGLSTVDDGIVIDLRALDRVVVHPGARVRVGGGALWRHVAETLSPHGLAISSGDTADVGVGGLTLSGGIGWMVRRHGLTIDHLRGVEMVTATGEVITADDAQHAELFWAIRGGGGAYGIVTAFEFQAQRVAKVAVGALTFPADEAARVVPAWIACMRTAPHAIGSTLTLANPLTGGNRAPIEVTLVRSDGGDLGEVLAELKATGTVLTAEEEHRPYAEILHPGAELPAGLRASVRNGFVPSSKTDDAARVVALLAAEEQPSAIILHSLGAAFSDVPVDATAFAHRNTELMVMTFAVSPDDAIDGVRARLDLLWSDLAPHVDGAYANSLDGTAAEAVAAVYPEVTLARLAAVKEVYDPDNLFRRHFGPRADNSR